MKKLIVSMLFLCIGIWGHGQTIDDWISIATVANVHKKEKEHLDKMLLKQAALTTPSTALSVAGALTIKTEHRLHKGLAHVYDLIDNAQVIVLLVKHSKEIIQVQDGILDYVSDKPEIAPLAAYYEVQFLKESTNAMVKLILAIKESRFNIMKNKQRLDLLYAASDTLKEIRNKSLKLYTFIEALHMAGSVDIDSEPLIIDLGEIISEMQIEIETITNL